MGDITRRVAPFQKRMLRTRFEASAWVDLNTGALSGPAALAGKRVIPFCGIGNPAAFLNQLESLGLKINVPFIFKDHHAYGKKDLLEMASAAEKTGVSTWVTTEKDAVKIKPFLPKNSDVFALRIGPVFQDASKDMLSSLLEQ